ncbi:MAG TPA: hypothetical protein VKP64_11390, partial [Mycobacteriales bacterium]|nr:hypothetical protein [Mycobacteriales bacterium]
MSRTVAGTGALSTPVVVGAVNDVAARTATLVCRSTWPNRSSKVRCSVSVSTMVPDTNATPMTTASAVRARRS